MARSRVFVGSVSDIFYALENPAETGSLEVRVLRFRSQARWLFFSVVIVVLLAFVTPYLLSFEPEGWFRLGLNLAIGIAFFTLFLLPLFRWLAKTTVITTQRITVRSGLLTRTMQEVALVQIAEIKLRRNVAQRIFNSGDILIKTVTGGGIVLHNVPGIKTVAGSLQELLTWQMP